MRPEAEAGDRDLGLGLGLGLVLGLGLGLGLPGPPEAGRCARRPRREIVISGISATPRVKGRSGTARGKADACNRHSGLGWKQKRDPISNAQPVQL